MKLFAKDQELIITWSDHQPACNHCRQVVLSQPKTYQQTCALGSQLLLEKLAENQAPVEREKRKANEKWAEARGTFVTHRTKNVRTLYKE